MKKILKSLIVLICVAIFLGFAPTNKSQANAATNNEISIQVVRTVENGVHYVIILLDGIQICKTVEL